MIGMTVYYSAKEYSGSRQMSPLLWKTEIGKWKLENKVASFQFLISTFQFPIRAF
jgi:hypothetical protein